MHLGERLLRHSTSRQRVGVNLGVLISRSLSFPLSLSLFYIFFLLFLPLQRFWTAAFWLTRTNSCATLTPSTGETLSKTLLPNSWWYRPTAVTMDVSIYACHPPLHVSHSPGVGLKLHCWLWFATFRSIILPVISYFSHVDITLALACEDNNS